MAVLGAVLIEVGVLLGIGLVVLRFARKGLFLDTAFHVVWWIFVAIAAGLVIGGSVTAALA